MKLLNLLNKTIEYSFYLLLFLVPLALTGDTSELFEFNKLWVTFILTLVIGTAWAAKMILKKEFRIQRTPLDIPILLFLASEILSTIFSMDAHTSLWGYYSRFNGGLFSILSYVFLFYAFVSNYKDLNTQETDQKSIKVSHIGVFLLSIVVFFGGNYLASLFAKTATTTLIPFSMLVSLLSVVASFALFMRISPVGMLKRTIYALLTSASLVILWGLPSHFGFDPTCLLFRGNLDVACWTADFQPKIRIFSTLGQPDWLAAYLVALLPIMVGVFVNFSKGKQLIEKGKSLFKNYNLIFAISLFALIGLSYLCLLYTVSRSAVLAIWIGFLFLGGYYFWVYVRPKFDRTKLTVDFKLGAAIVLLIAAVTFFNGQPFSQLDILTLKGIHGRLQTLMKTSAPAKPAVKPIIPATAGPTGELGGTDSGTIRKYVWQGAIDVWKHYPIFGSGLETFAYSYYQYRPLGHNLTSEWNFLYNKAHNEYLNYLATTGTLGIATYLLMIGTFLFLSLRYLYENRKKPTKTSLFIASLVSGYIGILISNFFGFSVVIINILFYLIPALVLLLSEMINFEKSLSFNLAQDKKANFALSKPQIGLAIITAFVGLYLVFVLARFWQADRYYYLGLNYDRTGDYQRAYPYLQSAVNLRPSEPTFKDELALNNGILASAIIYQSQQKPNQQSATLAKQLVDSAVSSSNKILQEHPNNIVFIKSRVRLFYTLSQVDPSYLPATLDAIKKAAVLAPTDADVSYNLGVLYGQTGDLKKGIEVLQNTIRLKPDYQGGNAYYALGIFYHQLSLDKNGKVVNSAYAQKAIDEMKLLIKTFGPNQQAQTALNTWNAGK